MANEFKYCPRCKECKSRELFHVSKSTKDGLNSFCIKCEREYRKKYMASKKGKVIWRNGHLRRTYGITAQVYSDLLKFQDGKCLICKSDSNDSDRRAKYFTVDHCHNTGSIRGLLCSRCNAMLGQAQDSIDILKSAIKYLTEQDNRCKEIELITSNCKQPKQTKLFPYL